MKKLCLLIACFSLALSALSHADEPITAIEKPDESWPPRLPNAVNGTVKIATDNFLIVPEKVKEGLAKPGAMQFVMAKTAPTVELAYHRDLPNRALNGTGWSAWGDICVASDGRVYSGIGDHGSNAGSSSAFIYCWDPAKGVLEKVADLNEVAGIQEGDPSWSKVHARIEESKDGKIYFTGTLNNGATAFQIKWTERVPGAQIFQYDPQTGKTIIVGAVPGEVMPTTLLDPQRNILYSNMEGKTGAQDVALTAFDLTTQKVIYQSPRDAVTGSRNIALARNGAVYFNGKDGLWKYDPNTKTIAATASKFPENSLMRSSTFESRAGFIYGTTSGVGMFFRYDVKQDKLEMLGPDFLSGDYTTVTVLSPDERFVYYLPGSHGGALDIGVPVVQYEIATRQRKVLAFLGEGIDKATGYAAGGTYGVKISSDGATLFVNFNGQPHAKIEKHAKAFGLTAFAAIHIPPSER